MVLTGKATLNRSLTARTQYLTIPADLAKDSQYPFKPGEKLMVRIFPEARAMILLGEEWKSLKWLEENKDAAVDGINAVIQDALNDALKGVTRL